MSAGGVEQTTLFISHAGADRAWAEWVAWQLEDAGYTTELDHWDWAAGDNVIVRMNEALERGRMVAIFSASYFDPARWTTEEWTAVLAARENLVPVRIDTTQAPPMLRAILAPSLVDLDEVAARRALLEAVDGPRRPHASPTFPGSLDPGRLRQFGGSGPRLPGSLPRVWNIPIRNIGFAGRDDLLVRVRRSLTKTFPAVAFHGRGGVGKTQLAIEYAHRFSGDYEFAWWVRCEEPALIAEQLAALATKIGAAPAGVAVPEACEALAEELRTRSRWLLIFDNAEDPAALTSHLPSGVGHTLITTRAPAWQSHATGIEVGVFDRGESIYLLRTRVPSLSRSDAGELAQTLDDLPLALVQAAALLDEGMAITQYRQLLSESISEVLDEGRPEAYPLSLAGQIRLSAQSLSRADQGAAVLLNACSLLAPEPFPLHACVRSVSDASATLAGLIAHPLAARRALGALARHNLARVHNGSVHVHRLTQAVVRDQLGACERTNATRAAEVLLISASPGNAADPATWGAWADLVPHLLALSPTDFVTDEGRDAACQACWYLMDRGQAETVLPRLQSIYQVWKEQLGPDHHDTLWAAQCLARAYSETRNHVLARELDEDTLNRRRRLLGEDHRDTLAAAANLAVRLAALKNTAEARKLGEDTLSGQRRVLGEDHQDTLTTASNLANRLSELDDVEAARKLGEDILTRRRRVLGHDHPDTLISGHNLEIWLAQLGHVEAARKLGEDILARRQRVLGHDHPDTLATASNLANRLGRSGAIEESKELAEDVLARQRQVLGHHHPSTLITAFTLATALAALDDNQTARNLYEDTLYWQRRVLGDDAPETLRTASNLGVILTVLNEITAARALGEETLSRQRRVLGLDHPETLASSHNLMIRLMRSGEISAARELGKETLLRRQRVLGPVHPDTMRTATLLHELQDDGTND
ncbi:FxSxx-COOH system tetratricopeptide repeat protein [Streptomyces chartreusis]|uniref:FxSxx-COOH system tetratricopeptide repeat protein n=1 Tax=Streptomyces chartreusis TaxID=1969 RepID=UPI0036F6F622